jgi:hypothetical protein
LTLQRSVLNAVKADTWISLAVFSILVIELVFKINDGRRDEL